MSSLRIAIAGAGIGGMTLAALLHRAGHEVTLVEKAATFCEIGAGIQISPNGARVLSEIGLDDDLSTIGTVPERVVLRRWKDDEELLVRAQGTLPVERYGFPFYNVYRPDLVSILAAAVAGLRVRFDAEVVAARNADGFALLELASGSTIEADLVVGADGIHSSVRDSVFGATPSRFGRSIAYRALVPRDRVADLPIEVTNRMGPDRHMVSYFVGQGQRYLNLVCVVPEATWDVEGWNEPGTIEDLRSHFASWSSEVDRILGQIAGPVYRWALYDRPPMDHWTAGRIALLGDACHAMLPFMAQGACQAIEDAAVLARLLTENSESPEASLKRYELIRQPRAAKIQSLAWRNATTFHLPDGPEQRARDQRLAASGMNDDGDDPLEWLYAYDALIADHH